MIPLAMAAATYKWIDERGVVNYGDAPPAAARQVKQLDEDASRVSTIPSVPRAQVERESDRLLRARLARLEEELEDLRRARAATQVPMPAYEPYYAYPPFGVYAPAYAVPLYRPRFRAAHRPVHAPLRGGLSVRVIATRR
ncbi:MAG TPA: DUF4124 domain-containing protein [Burkholderiales bacterium]|nr:DUF4124 domain-containing protein [Burkholderiales bacterium]